MSLHDDDIEMAFASGYLAGATDVQRLRYVAAPSLVRLGVEAWERFRTRRAASASERLSPRTQGIQTGRAA